MPIPTQKAQNVKPNDKWVRVRFWVPLWNINQIWSEHIAVSFSEYLVTYCGSCEDQAQVLIAIRQPNEIIKWEPYRRLTAIVDEKVWKNQIGQDVLDRILILEGMLGGKRILFMVEPITAAIGDAMPE